MECKGVSFEKAETMRNTKQKCQDFKMRRKHSLLKKSYQLLLGIFHSLSQAQ